ncbi:hypothetical protein JL722_4841 [Aureococcus anophagefferens]|nr:hypothetical protein JL722_4841 [Aureococcus anophagefferens]
MDGLPDPVDFARDSWARAKAWARRQDPRDVALCAGAGLAEAETARASRRDAEEAKRFGVQKFAGSVFGVADSLRLARGAAGADAEAFARRASCTLAPPHQVTCFEPSPGEAFDPATMEALRADAAPDGGRAVVAEVLQRGYVLHDRVIRAAAVVTTNAGDGGEAAT